MSPRSPGPNATEISRFGRYEIRPGRGRKRRKGCWLAPVRPRIMRISRIRSSGPGHPLATPTIPPAGLSRGGVTTKARSSRRKRIGCDGGFGGANIAEEWGHTRDWGGCKLGVRGGFSPRRKVAKVDGARRFARESRECRESPMRQGHPAAALTHLCCSTVYCLLSTY
jgi:hypothetical protein